MSTTNWRNRIIGEGEEPPDQLLANPGNWRIHPQAQEEAQEKAVLAVLDPLSAMAVADEEALNALLAEVSVSDEALKAMLDGLKALDAGGEGTEGATGPCGCPEGGHEQ